MRPQDHPRNLTAIGKPSKTIDCSDKSTLAGWRTLATIVRAAPRKQDAPENDSRLCSGIHAKTIGKTKGPRWYTRVPRDLRPLHVGSGGSRTEDAENLQNPWKKQWFRNAASYEGIRESTRKRCQQRPVALHTPAPLALPDLSYAVRVL